MMFFSDIARKLNRRPRLPWNLEKNCMSLPVYLVNVVFVSPIDIVISTSKLTKNTTDRFFIAKWKGVTEQH